AEGVRAFRDGDYAQAQTLLGRVLAKVKTKGAPIGILNEDWVLYLHGESAFYAGAVTKAQDDFDRLAKLKQSHLASVGAFRAADCAWTSGAHAEAAATYRRLLTHVPKGHDGAAIDQGAARFRVALDAEERHRPEATQLFLALYRDLPAHPLATEARRHLPEAGRPTTGAAPEATPSTGAAEDRLRRAETLTHDRHWDLALEELAKLPAELPHPLALERDYQIGMTKFNMRRDYPKAASLLLAVAPELTGDKAASALFHGTRALSRVDKDDDAIAGYKQVVTRFPHSRFAAEAQFLSGWLDYNRGRFKESLPGLHATLEHYGQSAFADDAAWCVAFAHFMVGELPEAATALAAYARLPPTGMTADERSSRVAYWRARIDAKAGRADAAKTGYQDVNRRWPFTFYGAAARARLVEAGAPASIELPRAPSLSPDASRRASADPTLARADELAAAGLDVEAGWELQQDEKGVLRRLGEAGGTRVLLDRYARWKAFHRAYELGESTHSGALGMAPEGAARPWWEAAYPRAYRDLVEKFGPPAGNPELFLYAIMRKESGFSPWDTSYADARGLLQMIPPTSAAVAEGLGLEFAPDELYEPEINVHLGATYIGGLSKKFGGQIPLVAGAYNAGPKAMSKWCDQHGHFPMDEFVELIAFTQTREYAKRVVGIYSRYRYLYGPKPYPLPLTVDPKYGAGGPDY
ncbi:MAG TPA: transglycosylase SLT domain-containing protein, partial [Polyangia bacterium]